MLWSLLGAALYVCAAVAVGEGVTRGRLGPTRGFLIGMFLLAAWPCCLSILSALQPWACALPLVVLPLFAPWRRLTSRVMTSLRDLRGSTLRERVLMAIMAIAFAATVFIAAAPPVGMDTLTYHLALPDQYLIRGSVSSIAANAYYLYPQLFEFAILPLLAFDRSGIAVNFLNVVLLMVLARLAWRLARDAGGSNEAGLLAAAACVSSPLLLNTLSLTKNDPFSLALLLAAAGLLIRSPTGLGWGALLAGGAFAVKPTTGLVVVPLVVVAAVCALSRSPRPRSERPSPMGSILPLGWGLLLPGIWLAHTYACTGRFLPDAFFSAHAFADYVAESGPGFVGRLHHLALAIFYRYIDGTDGPIGMPLLLLSVFVLARAVRGPTFRLTSIVLLAAIVLWTILGHGQARYLLGAFFLAGSVGAASVDDLDRRVIVGLTVLIVATLFYGTFVIARDHGLADWHLGRRTTEAYYARWLDAYPVLERGDRVLPADASVLAVGEAELFPLHRRAVFDAFWEPSRAMIWSHQHAHDTVALAAELRSHGLTHVLYNPRIYARLVASGLTPPSTCTEDARTLAWLQASSHVVVEDTVTGVVLFVVPAR